MVMYQLHAAMRAAQNVSSSSFNLFFEVKVELHPNKQNHISEMLNWDNKGIGPLLLSPKQNIWELNYPLPKGIKSFQIPGGRSPRSLEHHCTAVNDSCESCIFSYLTNLIPRLRILFPNIIYSSVQEWSPVCVFGNEMEFPRKAKAGIHGIRERISSYKCILVL